MVPFFLAVADVDRMKTKHPKLQLKFQLHPALLKTNPPHPFLSFTSPSQHSSSFDTL
jgi:hypothetical protein